MEIISGIIFALSVFFCVPATCPKSLPVNKPIPIMEAKNSQSDFICKSMTLIKSEQPALSDAEIYEIAHTITNVGEEFTCIDPLLLLALQKVESDFKSTATGARGERGINQIHPVTARELCAKLGWKYHPRLLHDINQSTFLAGLYLDYLYKKYGSVEAMLVGYSCGPLYALRFVKNDFAAIPDKGLDYVNDVLETYVRYQDQINNV